jgi:hypothetical protein
VRVLSLSSSICASSSSARSYARSAVREGQILELRVKVYGWKARLCALERMEGVRMAGVYCVLGPRHVNPAYREGKTYIPTKVNQVEPTQKGEHGVINADACSCEAIVVQARVRRRDGDEPRVFITIWRRRLHCDFLAKGNCVCEAGCFFPALAC